MEKKLWFKRKRYGYGWSPSSWEGWAVTLSYILISLALALSLSETASDTEAIFMLLLPLAVLTGLLVRITSDHGEKPRWQWGNFKNKK